MMDEGAPNQVGGPIGEIYANRTVLDTNELKSYCDAKGLEFNIVDLSQLDSFDKKYGFVHTGQEENAANGGNENHWLALYGNLLFDSYGKYSSWQLPAWVKPVKTIPKRLQSFDSNVCGAYCCEFLFFCESRGDALGTNIGRSFCQQYSFTKNTENNDRTILTAFEQVTPTVE